MAFEMEKSAPSVTKREMLGLGP